MFLRPEKDVVHFCSPGQDLESEDWDVAGETEEAITGPGPAETGEAGGGERTPHQQGGTGGLRLGGSGY